MSTNPLQERLAAVRAPRAAPVTAPQPASTGPVRSPRSRKPTDQRWDNRVRRATYYIDNGLLDELDEAAMRLGRNKSEIVRDALIRYLHEQA